MDEFKIVAICVCIVLVSLIIGMTVYETSYTHNFKDSKAEQLYACSKLGNSNTISECSKNVLSQ